ncbi:hypothetical protein OTK49_01780 [Vibrio coralliirubri]|uniref:hypothetical protein n=1 Tax=Vibrio coralliirubri TaxID=1516159 RepID=UPI0022849605|nr:hypothetical protein [Vibrio coralliirubri]MCY9861243.1 hypothetical protein [Vibrio coralliirubri]
MVLESHIADFSTSFFKFRERAEAHKFSCNATIETDYCSVYLRKHLTGVGEFDYHLCIGSIELRPDLVGKGLFKAMIVFLEQNIGHFRAIEFESIMNPKLSDMLRKNGYTPSKHRENSIYSINLIKRIT